MKSCPKCGSHKIIWIQSDESGLACCGECGHEAPKTEFEVEVSEW